MSNQPENEMQQILTPEEVRQSLLAEIEASKQAIQELSDKDLEEAIGGAVVYLPRGGNTMIKVLGGIWGASQQAGRRLGRYGS